nr:maleylpyruvate isomerase family mycothiol-dependent enzyme [Psychromicrobium silvestre]
MIDTERAHLLEVLEKLTDDQWNADSLCAGWRVRDVVVHLLMSYQLSMPRFLSKMIAAGFNFDKMADRWATGDPRSKSQILEALRLTRGARFRVPGAPPEAPLSHLVIHAEDIYRPLGINHAITPESARIVLDQLVTPQAQRSLKPGLLDGLAFSSLDCDWSYGKGAEVVGTSSALIATLAGRASAIDELTGDGVAQLRP